MRHSGGSCPSAMQHSSIARDHGPALCGIARELSVEIFPADPALCNIARDHGPALCNSSPVL
jgi:hypothetical protein